MPPANPLVFPQGTPSVSRKLRHGDFVDAVVMAAVHDAGAIPKELGRLAALQRLLLSNNQLIGEAAWEEERWRCFDVGIVGEDILMIDGWRAYPRRTFPGAILVVMRRCRCDAPREQSAQQSVVTVIFGVGPLDHGLQRITI